MQEPACLDGGDVLVMPTEIFVGLSKRSNKEAVEVLSKAFPSRKVFGVPVKANLHLKSSLSALDEKTIVVADKDFARETMENINKVAETPYDVIYVPDIPASNVVRV